MDVTTVRIARRAVLADDLSAPRGLSEQRGWDQDPRWAPKNRNDGGSCEVKKGPVWQPCET